MAGVPKPKVKFGNAADPTDAELRAWAACADPEPMEDWDLDVLAAPRYAPVLVDLVANENCPSRRYALGALYVLVGETVRGKLAGVSPGDLEPVLRSAEAAGNTWLTTWADRSRRLLAQPAEFDYVAWCAGGHAKNPVG